MRQYRYVMAASDGTSYDYSRGDHFETDSFDLPQLLADGWRPVRETPMGEGTWIVSGESVEYALALILLTKKVAAPKKADRKNKKKKDEEPGAKAGT